MAVEFLKRSNTPYVATSGSTIVCSSTSKNLILYDGIKTVKGETYYYITINGEKRWYNDEGTIVPEPSQD